jgi:hypothetical protein
MKIPRKVVVAIGAAAMRKAAFEMECQISSGNVAECAAYVEGEVGRQAAIDNRDCLRDEPAEWLYAWADLYEKGMVS